MDRDDLIAKLLMSPWVYKQDLSTSTPAHPYAKCRFEMRWHFVIYVWETDCQVYSKNNKFEDGDRVPARESMSFESTNSFLDDCIAKEREKRKHDP